MKVAVMCLILILIVPVALALGIAPANNEVTYGINTPNELTYRVYNTEARDMAVSITANGSLAQYITIDQPTIQFAANERFKTLTIRLADVPIQKALVADINAESDTKVTARLTVVRQASTLTTNAVKENEKEDNHYMTIGLAGLILGNIVLFTVAGVRKHRKSRILSVRHAKTLQDLLNTLKTMSEPNFRSSVTKDKNEFADWLELHGYPELAFNVYDMNERMQIIEFIEDHDKKDEPKDNEDLRKEIGELKRELDTFDFTEFEKVYK
jgi:hypothetical protein